MAVGLFRSCSSCSNLLMVFIGKEIKDEKKNKKETLMTPTTTTALLALSSQPACYTTHKYLPSSVICNKCLLLMYAIQLSFHHGENTQHSR